MDEKRLSEPLDDETLEEARELTRDILLDDGEDELAVWWATLVDGLLDHIDYLRARIAVLEADREPADFDL